MTDKPRKHHFVPQFWIRRFAGADGRLLAYDHGTGRIGAHSSKKLMQIFNLYTVQPSVADDTTLETVDLNKVDSEGSAVFDRIISGDLSQSAKEALASFLAVQVLRDPDVVTSYNPRAQELTLGLLAAFDTPNFDNFRQRWEAQFPGASISESEFRSVLALGLRGVENALELIINALDKSEGLPELPFTDAVRSPDGRNIVRNRLLEFEWTLKSDAAGRFVLGDAGVLYNKGAMQCLSAPLSRDVALVLTTSNNPRTGISSVAAADYDIANLNLESAARARRWLVGERVELERLKSQVGSRSFPVGY